MMDERSRVWDNRSKTSFVRAGKVRPRQEVSESERKKGAKNSSPGNFLRFCGDYPKTCLSVLLPLVLIAGLGFAVYANSIKGEFVWDDEYLVKENVFIKSPSYIQQIFTTHIAAGSGKTANSYRPLQILSYMLDYSLWELDVRGYHITNILLHILAALSIFCFVNVFYKDEFLSLLTSALFVAHPIHTEAVSYISGRADPMALVFMLLSFIFYIRYTASSRISLCIYSALSFICALLSRESSLMLPLLILAHHYSFKRPIKAVGLIWLSAIAVLYILIRITVLKGTFSYLIVPTTLPQRLPGFFAALADYIRLIFLPFGLHMEYGDKIFMWADSKVILGILIFLMLFIYLIRKTRKGSAVSFALLWFFIALIPSSNIYPLNAYMAEHWLYLPSVGFFIIIAGVLNSLYRKPKLRGWAAVLIIVILGSYSFLTVRQNKYWREPEFFYERTLKYAYNNLRVYNNLGAVYYNKGMREKAVEMYKRALEINPKHIEAYNNLGVVYFNMDRREEAKAVLLKAIEMNPRYASAYSNLGNVYIKMGRLKEAINSYKKALDINPNYAAAHSNIAVAYYDNGDYQLAIDHCDKALGLGYKVNPEFLKLLKPYREKED